MSSRWAPPGPALLFCPADRPDRYAKAAAAADMVLLDLEDGVAAADKAAARDRLTHTLLDPERTVVRINPADTADHELDLRALASTPYTLVMLAKTESAAQVEALAPLRVIALCETALGVLAAPQIAAAGPAAMMWGAEDLVASLGGRSSRGPGGRYRDVARHARSQVLLASKAAGVPAIDAVHLNIDDIKGLASEAEDAAACGFDATACIHPSQVEVVRAAYRPTEPEIAWARRVLAAAEGSAGVFRLDGQMVDAPVLRQAEQIVSRVS
jgi:citrate lyase subunit beta/citryl-CoA lyase